jgi:hypothetical protein
VRPTKKNLPFRETRRGRIMEGGKFFPLQYTADLSILQETYEKTYLISEKYTRNS